MTTGRVTNAQINERLGFGFGYPLLWTAVIVKKLGVEPAGHDRDGCWWTEDQFIEICRRLRDKLDAAITNYTDEDL